METRKKREAKVKRKAFRDANPGVLQDRVRKSRKLNRSAWHFYSTKASSKKRGVAFDLTVEWIKGRLDAGICEMSGLPFDMGTKRGPNTPSIDRIDPFGGYTQANCRMIIWFLNHAMGNRGEEYTLMVFRKVLERRSA